MKWFSKPKDKYTRVKFVHNKFFFEDENMPAKIFINKNEYAQVFVNGTLIEKETELRSTDSIVIEYKNNIIEEPRCQFEILTDENHLEASLKKIVKVGKKYEFKPITEYTHNLKLEIVELDYYPEPNDFDEIESFLRKQGLNGVFNDENIKEICISESNIILPVVSAKLPVPGKPARFELIGSLKNGDHIQENQFFAEFVDETPGIPGYDIYGIEIKPNTLDFFPEIGENVLIEDRGLMSLKKGRLVFTPYKINVIEEQTVKKTINFEDRIVEYDGDVVIDGDVKEGGQIKCNGNITILGGVFESYVCADGNVTVKGNAEQAIIYSGFSKIAAKQIESYSLQYLEIFERIMFESSFTAEDGFDYSEKTKSLELAKSEFLAIEQSIEPFVSLVDQFGSKEIQELYQKFLDICKNGVKVALNDQSNTEDIRNEMEKFYSIISQSKEHLKDDLGALEMNSANGSHLFGYNSITITGSGIFQTNIQSYHSVKIANKSLSSSIEAEDYIEVNEYKPGNQEQTKLYVKKNNGYIKVHKLHSDSLLQIGDRKYMNEADEFGVMYKANTFPKK